MLLAGCLVTPYKILAPPLPSVHSEKSLQLYYIQGPVPAATDRYSGHAYRCGIASEQEWFDDEFRKGGHAQACGGGQQRYYDFAYDQGRWGFAEQAKARALGGSVAAGAGPVRYVLCTKSGTRVETLGATLNDSSPRVELKDRGCREYVPPPEQGLDLYYFDTPLAAASNAQTITAYFCGTRQQKKFFDFGFRQGGHGFACTDGAKAWGSYEFSYGSNRWVLRDGVKAPLPQSGPYAASPDKAPRHYVMCKRIGPQPQPQAAAAGEASPIPAKVQRTSCSGYSPPALKPLGR